MQKHAPAHAVARATAAPDTLWRVLDECCRIPHGRLLPPRIIARLIDDAAARFALDRRVAATTVEAYLAVYVLGSDWRWLPDIQRQALLDALAARQHPPTVPADTWPF